MATYFFLRDALEDRPVVVSKAGLEVMYEQGPKATDEQTEWNVNDPVYAEVHDGEDEQQGVDEDKHVVGPMPPLAQGTAGLLNMQIVEHKDTEGNRHVEAGDGVVERIVQCVEDGVPAFLVEQSVHTGYP